MGKDSSIHYFHFRWLAVQPGKRNSLFFKKKTEGFVVDLRGLLPFIPQEDKSQRCQNVAWFKKTSGTLV
jgi:hypothetical protein